ncbi:MAG: 16S rRNA (cytidine(1402)-2'-O)-methyltransferase [Thermotogae bacterium]|nr:MAG: 16S rRNA (cytidine(1402)-2'-O)-methyltransferase [Thermotogota bacterium]
MGTLFIVGTPIGNLKDITQRALEVIKSADAILAEDKRVTIKLLNLLNLGRKELWTLNEHNVLRQIPRILRELRKGKMVALVSDAGMPVISDPGHQLVAACWREAIPVQVIPGPSAVTAALAASGFSGSRFVFEGFMPRGRSRRKLLRSLKDERRTIVFYESPQRIKETLKDVLEIMGNREIFVAREMTKLHEEYIRGRVSEVLQRLGDEVKGEITVVISNEGTP